MLSSWNAMRLDDSTAKRGELTVAEMQGEDGGWDCVWGGLREICPLVFRCLSVFFFFVKARASRRGVIVKVR
jgi:hypothetical protein